MTESTPPDPQPMLPPLPYSVPVAGLVPTPELTAIDDGTVAGEFPCRKCGYNLRGLDRAGRCPECGSPVELSLRGDQLRFSDPAWLGRLALGMKTLLTGATLVVVYFVIYFMLGFLLRPVRFRTYLVWVQAVAFVASLLNVAGCWFVAAAEPGGAAAPQVERLRKLARTATLVAALRPLVTLIEAELFLPGELRKILIWVMIACMAAGVVGDVALLRYMAHLADRLPSSDLATRARRLARGFGWTDGLFVVMMAIVTVAGGVRRGAMPSVATGVFGCSAIIMAISFLFFGVIYLIMLVQWINHLRRQRGLAQASWRAAGHIAS